MVRDKSRNELAVKAWEKAPKELSKEKLMYRCPKKTGISESQHEASPRRLIDTRTATESGFHVNDKTRHLIVTGVYKVHVFQTWDHVAILVLAC